MVRLLLCLTAVLHLSSSTELCQGDKLCVLCTVTGPTVINIDGHVDSVSDRCVYTLMKTASMPDFQVQATFKERRRQDVSFLDSVFLWLNQPGVGINLEQGGRVQIGNLAMTLNATAQVVHNVELSKDVSGVTAKMTQSDYNMTVFFDGYTAQIHIAGPTGQLSSVEGLCSNMTLSESKLSDKSPDGCDTQYEEAPGSTINCQEMTQRCNLLKEASFSACHSYIDPTPFITACNDTLCQYPDVDGLNCQFLEAYARACSLYSNDTMDDWRSNANCSGGPQAFCQDRFCSPHEFCGDSSDDDGTRCFCRAIFASPYKSQNTLGDGVYCNGTFRSTTLYNCLLADRDILYSDLHLYDSSCRGVMDNEAHTVTFSFDTESETCGTMITMNNNSEIINKNVIKVDGTGGELLDFTCPFTLPDIDIDFSLGVTVLDSNTSDSSVEYITSGFWNFTLAMKAYTDPGRTSPVDSHTYLHLNQKVWFAITTDGLDKNTVALVTESCFATSKPDADSSLKYFLIINGCPNPDDKTVNVESNGVGTFTYFSFNMFKFTGQDRVVYLHCKMKLCVKSSNICSPTCSRTSRRRRSALHKDNDETAMTLSMAWT